MGVIDESCMVKRGQQSVGVKRQYCGRLGKVENCQVGVYLSYVSPHDRGLLDRELYLPEEWCQDTARRTAAQVPVEVGFKTKPQLALQMLDRSWNEGIALEWITADTTYGNSPSFRNHIHNTQHRYVVAIAKNMPLRHPLRPVRQRAEQLASLIPANQWEVWSVHEGEMGEVWYEWAHLPVIAPNDEVGEQWLLIRRPPGRMVEADFYLSNASADTDWLIVAQVASTRHTIEQVFEDAKGEVGMADYEVRYWHSWYRHMTLVMVALTWLTLLRLPDREKNATTSLDASQPG
jgi:SRSO17 transposase